jgi:hypothetical protein
MTISDNGNVVVNDDGSFNVGKYSTRANLPTGAAGYLSYVSDQQEFVVNTATAVSASSSSPDQNVTWYKFRTKPMDYKNEVIFEQGTIGGGYVSSTIYNSIARIIYSTDIYTLDAVTMSFVNKYGGHFSTYLNAYYLQGNNGTGVNSQDWATGTVSTITSNPNGWNSPNSTQPGPKLSNTYGMLMSGTSVYNLTFSTNTWAAGTSCPTSQGFGDGSPGQSFAYTYTFGSSVQKWNFNSNVWVSTSSGNHISAAGNYGKTLPSKWNKFYYMGDNSSSSYVTVSGYNQSTDAWYNTNSNIGTWSEGTGLMGQDWGYNIGGYNVATGSQGAYATKTFYANDTNLVSSLATPTQGASSAAGCYGPIP